MGSSCRSVCLCLRVQTVISYHTPVIPWFWCDQILCIYWPIGKDLDTVDNIQVWDSVWSDTDLQGDHLRMFKRCDVQDQVNLVKKWKERKNEMAKVDQKLRPCTQLVGPEPAPPHLYAFQYYSASSGPIRCLAYCTKILSTNKGGRHLGKPSQIWNFPNHLPPPPQKNSGMVIS